MSASDNDSNRKGNSPMKAGLSMLALAFAFALPHAHAAPVKPGPEMIVTRASARSVDEVADAIKAYTKAHKWQLVGDEKVKNGEVTLVKVCIPAVGKALWPAGLQMSALLPCGNFGLYRKGGQTEISMLHPSYMEVLYPSAEVRKAVEVATPMLMGLLDAAAK
jgi:uncharacterized protein (DUF302 family)